MQPFRVKEDVIHQWIALGLIEPSNNTISAMKLAEEYIGRLLDMSFLQTAKLQQVLLHASKKFLFRYFWFGTWYAYKESNYKII